MKRIFFVEDDLSLINGLSFAIKKQGYEIDIARTSSEAENLWMNGKYDLVILDVCEYWQTEKLNSFSSVSC